MRAAGRNRVVTAAAEGIATENPPAPESRSFESAVHLHGFNEIVRTSRREAAPSHWPGQDVQRATEKTLIKADASDKEASYHTERISLDCNTTNSFSRRSYDALEDLFRATTTT